MSIYQNIKNEVTLRAINARGNKGILKIKNEVALKAIDACGDKGILKNANNDELTGDVKIRHQNAMGRQINMRIKMVMLILMFRLYLHVCMV